MDTNNASAVDEYPLNFLYELTSLKNLATTSLALDLWHHNQLGHFRTEKSNYYEANFNCDQVLRISLPGCITKLIDGRIRSLGQELQALYRCFKYLEIVRNNRTFSMFFDSLVYGPDGKMCTERSARNILMMNELTPMKKFQIACIYWFEDEIRQLWPSVSDLKELKEEMFGYDFYCRVFWHYWIVEMRNSPDEYPLKHYSTSLPNRGELTIARNWTAQLYLLNTGTTECQHSFIRDLVECYQSDDKYLLSKLNKVQVDYLLSNFPEEIITELTLSEGCTEYALRIWDLLRNNIKVVFFFDILLSLFYHAYQRYSCSEDGKLECEQAQVVLFEIWITSPNRLKMLFFDSKYLEYFFDGLRKYSEEVHQHPTFFSELFSDMPMEMRSSIWYKHWRKMIVHCPITVLNHLLKLCLNDERRIERFVEEEMLNFTKIGKIMDYWFTKTLYVKMINYTKLCSWNENLVGELRKQIFSTIIPNDFTLDELFKLGEAIDKNLSNDDLKRTVLFSSNVQKLFQTTLTKGSAKEVIYAIDRFMPTRRSPHEKQLFLGYWRHFLNLKSKRIYYIDSPCTQWEEFLFWWVDNKDDLPMFKQSLPVDEIFENLLVKAALNLASRLGPLDKVVSQPAPSPIGKQQEFVHVDDFLMWYCGNWKAVRCYKLNKIWNYRKMVKLNNLLSINNEFIVNCILGWFYTDNIEKVVRFKENFEKKG